MRGINEIKKKIESLKGNAILAKNHREIKDAKVWIVSAIENLQWVLEDPNQEKSRP